MIPLSLVCLIVRAESGAVYGDDGILVTIHEQQANFLLRA